MQSPTGTLGQTQAFAGSKGYFRLSSYALNALADTTAGQGSVGWAVGDRGALLHFGGDAQSGAAAADKTPPLLGAPTPGTLSDKQPYQPFNGPLSAQPGVVPALLSQPLDRLADPRLIAGGSPDMIRPQSSYPIEDVGSVVMSRDGSEGWAVGPRPGIGDGGTAPIGTALYHYVHGDWQRCDALGSGGLAADPACASLADVVRFKPIGSNTPVQLSALARVPTENGGRPVEGQRLRAGRRRHRLRTARRQPLPCHDPALRPRTLDGRPVSPRANRQRCQPILGPSFCRSTSPLLRRAMAGS